MENLIEFKGFWFNPNTPQRVMELIVRYYDNRTTRLLFDFGNVETGESWGEELDIAGYIGRSTGTKKIPLLIHNKRSTGGGSILTHCILTIKESKGKKLLYKHESVK